MKMEAKDLMIGDWVLHNWGEKQPCKVVAISEEEINVFVGEDVIDLNEGEFEPIPIIDEFLEKNGFVNKDVTIDLFGRKSCWNATYQRTGTARNGNDIFINYKIDTNCLIITHQANNFMYFGIVVKYVHELQHALRLVGLSEIANNLKV